MGGWGWKNPFPRKFGGNAHQPVHDFFTSIEANRPQILQGGGDATEVHGENIVMARMLARGWRDTRRRALQADPRCLSAAKRQVKHPETGEVTYLSMLERWEAILNTRPSSTDSLQARRAAVLGKVRGYAGTARADVTSAMSGLFGSWFQGVFESAVGDVHYAGKVPAGNVHAYWADNTMTFSAQYPGEYDATKPWTTGLARINVGILPPASTPQAEITARMGQALQILDDMLPEWMSAIISQWGPGQTTPGFYVGVSHLGLTAL